MLHGAQCRWCTEAMQGGSSARCWQSTRCIPPCSRSAVYLGRSCAKHQVCWKASRRARIPRGGICPRERRLTFPSLGCRNNTGAHPALSLGQADPPPPHHPPSVPSHVLCTTGEGVHRVAGGQTWIRDVSPFLSLPRCFSGADVHRGEQTPPPTGSTAPNGAVHESWGPSQSSTSSAPMCWAQLPSGRGCSVCRQPPASLHLVPAGGWTAKPPPLGCWHRQLEAGSACWDTLSCPCGGRRGGNNHGRPLAQHREP